MALAGLVVGGRGAYLLRNIDLEQIDKYYGDKVQEHLEEIDRMTPTQAYEAWEQIRVMGPGVADSAPTVRARHFRDISLRMTILGFSMAAIGILMAAGSLVQRRSKAKG